MVRRLATAAAAAALLGSMASGTPASAALVDVCTPGNLVCVLVVTDRGEGCPPGTQQVAGVPIPRTNQAVARVCAAS